MARFSKQQEELAARLLADAIMRTLNNEVLGRATHLIHRFSTSTVPPRKGIDKCNIVLNLEIPVDALFEIEGRVKLNGSFTDRY